MKRRTAINWELAEPRNATEAAFLAKAWTGARTLEERAHHLADLHALGITLPDDDETPGARRAWEHRAHLASLATKWQPPAGHAPRMPDRLAMPTNPGELRFAITPSAQAPRLVDRLEALACAHAQGHKLADCADPHALALWDFVEMADQGPAH